VVGGVALRHSVVGDQALRALGQEHLVAELHRSTHFAPLERLAFTFSRIIP
jgi:hypothetical protein